MFLSEDGPHGVRHLSRIGDLGLSEASRDTGRNVLKHILVDLSLCHVRLIRAPVLVDELWRGDFLPELQSQQMRRLLLLECGLELGPVVQ